MRKSGRWMSIIDERILEYLEEHEFGSPSEFHEAAGMDYACAYFSERASKLVDHGLIQRISPRGVYRITDDGKAYLRGEYDAREHDEKQSDGGAVVGA